MFIPGWCGTMVQVPASSSALTSLSIASSHLSLLVDVKTEEIVGLTIRICRCLDAKSSCKNKRGKLLTTKQLLSST
jgi:hypothetical protein